MRKITLLIVGFWACLVLKVILRVNIGWVNVTPILKFRLAIKTISTCKLLGVFI